MACDLISRGYYTLTPNGPLVRDLNPCELAAEERRAAELARKWARESARDRERATVAPPPAKACPVEVETRVMKKVRVEVRDTCGKLISALDEWRPA